MVKPQRLQIVICGAVQGVGFRPFVYRLAVEMNLCGWIVNTSQGVFIEVEGEKETLDKFILRIEKERPLHSFFQSFEFSFLDPVGYTTFEIRDSQSSENTSVFVLPDIAVCPECVQEILNSSNRRYRYPFTNCTNCGPRFSIIERLPYDRPNTTMKVFEMCNECRREYEDPRDRRFHAQPIACPQCGPHLELWDESGNFLSSHDEALIQAAEYIRDGKIVAMKGLGGFQLIVDARDEMAVVRLRQRKHREEKPFALMYSTIEMAKNNCEISELEERLLLSPESPIVLLKRKIHNNKCTSEIAPSVAPNNPYLGVMLPYTPLHHLLMCELGFPIVATSGNLSDEPICIDEREALCRLAGITDVFLVHNRPIKRHVDDSVVRVMLGRELVLRRARGYAPLPIAIREYSESPLLAVGAHLKNTIAITSGKNVFISQHIGDLETKEAYGAFQSVIDCFKTLYNVNPAKIICDMHPDYLSTQYARGDGHSVESIQHHHAHIASCMAENQLDGTVLGISWDGTGYGLDGTIWGGEFLLINEASFERVGHFRYFMLPGGEVAIREPRRTALGVLFEVFGQRIFEREDIIPLNYFNNDERSLFRQMLEKRIHSPHTSSVGRLFDAVAALIGLRQKVSFEGQAAMELEFLTAGVKNDESYSFQISNANKSAFHNSQPMMIIDWQSMIVNILDEMRIGASLSVISTKFHNTLTEIIVEVAKRAGERKIVLTGGCFQNKYLTERTVHRLQAEGFRVYWHQRVPPNDGGISLGQIYAYIKKHTRTRQIIHCKCEQTTHHHDSHYRKDY